MTLPIKLLLCDLDGTLVKAWTPESLPGVRQRLLALQSLGIPVALVTNQGGVGYRYAYQQMAQYEAMLHYPTPSEVIHRLAAVADPFRLQALYAGWHHGVLNWPLPPWGDAPVTGPEAWSPEVQRSLPPLAWSWSPTWRKPTPGMLLQALRDVGVAAADALMVGDLNSDRDAAKAADIPFQWAKAFFQPEVPA